MTNEQKIIVVVDDNNANLIAIKNILKPHYVVYPAPSAAKMFELLEHITPDLILLDVEMPETDGYEATRILKDNAAFKNIPIIFLSARIDATSEMVGLNIGALDFLHKPFCSTLLLKRIEMYLSLIEYRKIIEELLEEKTKLSNELDMVKIQAGKFELICADFNFGKMLANIAEECDLEAKEKKQELLCNICEEASLHVTGDEMRLSQAITNLLLNAVYYTPENGKIALNVERKEETEEEITFKIEVDDNGNGIPEDRQKDLFCFDGGNFGLPISKHIVELMGGALSLESKLNKGTKVKLTVKMKKSNPA